jgi:two-component system response regulator DevR
MNPVRVVLVEDDPLVRQGLRSILDADPRIQVAGEAAAAAEALRLVAETQPDAVLLDLKLGDTMSGVDLCEPLLQACTGTAVVVLTAFLDRDLLEACLRAGARGYLLKDAETLDLPGGLLAAVEGRAVLDPRAAALLQEPEPGACPLSPPELKVLGRMCMGLTNQEIAGQLSLSEDKVRGHVQEILHKLGARTRVEAVVLAHERGLV